jgi:hypothetical protein
MTEDPTDLVLYRTWRPQLPVIGSGGLPSTGRCDNLLLPVSMARLSLRLPSTLDVVAAGAFLPESEKNLIPVCKSR